MYISHAKKMLPHSHLHPHKVLSAQDDLQRPRAVLPDLGLDSGDYLLVHVDLLLRLLDQLVAGKKLVLLRVEVAEVPAEELRRAEEDVFVTLETALMYNERAFSAPRSSHLVGGLVCADLF